MTSLVSLEGGAPPTLLQTLRGHGPSGEISCCDIAVGGARLLTGGGDRSLKVWTWKPGTGWELLTAAARAHRYGITAARWSPGGALAASGGVDGAARVWSARELSPRRLLAAPGAPALRSLSWANAGILLCGYDDGSASVWQVPNASLLARIHAHEGALHALCAPARGAMLLAACTNGVLKAFDLQDICRCSAEGASEPAPVLWVDGVHDLGVLCCDVTPDGRTVSTGGHDARIRLWHIRGEGAQRQLEAGSVLEGHGAAVTAVRWNTKVLASASLDRTARLWSLLGTCICVLHAHDRYLTCTALAPDLRYMITGSNDKTIRVWSLGNMTLDDELEPACNPLAHFAIGDLEGIGPVDDDELLASEDRGSDGSVGSTESDGGASRLLWRSLAIHGGAVNCITVHGDTLATACSDGIVRLFHWTGEGLELDKELGSKGYPALAVDFGSNGALLFTAGLDGVARLWDVESGCMLRCLAPPTAAEHESGGGGARGARVSPHRPPFLLLATDDGVAPVWNLAEADPAPIHVYGGHVEAATCCAWSRCGRVLATGGAAGELQVSTPPPAARTLCHLADAHDLGVQSCDFAPLDAADLPENTILLASAGCDDLIKLWTITLDEDLASSSEATAFVASSVLGHGGGVSAVRWGAGGLLASGGADGWARLWRWAGGTLRQLAAVPAHAAAGIASSVLLDSGVVVLGSLSGELAVWRLPAVEVLAGVEGAEGDEGSEEVEEGEGGTEPRWWGAGGVARWIRDYITRVPGAVVDEATEETLLERARVNDLTGARLLDDPLDDLLAIFSGAEIIEDNEDQNEEIEKDEAKEQQKEIRARLLEELIWLRKDPADPSLSRSAPHWMLCPLSHALAQEPARAADGITYDRLALHEWFLAADGAISAVSGRRLRNARVVPNYACRAALRDFLQRHTPD